MSDSKPLVGFFDGNSSVDTFRSVAGKKILSLELVVDAERTYANDPTSYLQFELEGGAKIRMCDLGQECCEERYITTDDKLSDFIGSHLISAEVRDAPDIKNEAGGVHEVRFLIVTTSLGAFTCETHNVHSGYYSGFELAVIPVD
ncbi:hypothetical protein GF380_02740 [Candidatus Uhrbacteria bacterium]|nr:hypothetical protein [Candidatus Uhrbacteria bacterium]